MKDETLYAIWAGVVTCERCGRRKSKSMGCPDKCKERK